MPEITIKEIGEVMRSSKGNATVNINENAMAEAVAVAQGKKSGSVISGAANELIRRSADESYATLDSMLEACKASREISRQATVNLAELSVSPENNLSLALPNGNLAQLTHYSFGQLVKKIGYNSLDLINRLPANLAADVINHGLKNVALGSVADTEIEPWNADAIGGRAANVNAKLLWQENGKIILNSVTNPSYGRFFDFESAEFAKKLQDDCKLDGLPTDGIIRNDIRGSFFKGDRDSFIVLRDNSRRIFEKDENGGLSRMVMIGNSEVESRPWTCIGGFYAYVCANWNFWNATEAFSISLRHSKNFRDNFKPDDMLSAVKKFFESSPELEEKFIESARSKTLGDLEETEKTLIGLSPMLGKKTVKNLIELADLRSERYNAPANSVWTLGNCITEHAQDAKFTNVRVAWQQTAEKVFDLAA